MDKHIAIGVIVTICLISIVVYFAMYGKDNFDSLKRAEKIVTDATPVFSGEKSSYSEWKKKMGADTDAVEYTAIKQLWNEKRFTVPDVQKELLQIDPRAK
jgi:hypothetical protein